MSLLLDTHAFEWMVNNDQRLSSRVSALIATKTPHELLVSDVTIIELSRLLRCGKIAVGDSLAWLKRASRFVAILPVSPEIAWEATGFDWLSDGVPHRDPADRLIVATARLHNLPLATKDRKIHEFAAAAGVQVIW